MTRYAKRKLKYSLNENFSLLPYVEWDRFVTLTGAQANEGYVIVSRSRHDIAAKLLNQHSLTHSRTHERIFK
jgi:hypothetical protein